MYGPVTVLINTRPRSFKFYDDGVYYDKDCGKSPISGVFTLGYSTKGKR